ncbi:MAG: DUF481 domain-containing protein, partial [Planctomycetes bacterium]|nr:DUF481 domain-containing protein [Planctomycetota bacterium]
MSLELPTIFLTVLSTLVPTEPTHKSSGEVTEPKAPVVLPAETVIAPLESGIELRASQDSATDMQAAAQDAMKDKKLETLTGAITAGGSISSGNTAVRRANVNANAEYLLDEKNRVSGLFDWLYTDEKDPFTKKVKLTQRRVRGALQYDRFFSDKLYGFARADAVHDALQSLSLRLIGSVGVGYQILQEEKSSWVVEAGLAYVHSDFKNAAANAILTGQMFDDPTGDLSARVATKYWRQVTDDLKYSFAAEWFPSLEDQSRHVAYVSNQLDYVIGKGFTTSLRWEFDYNNTPGYRTNGDRLERLDHRIIWGLGYT